MKRSEVERELMVRELKAALEEMKTMRAILPICSHCKRIRDDEDYWHSIEHYISMHTPTMFSHGMIFHGRQICHARKPRCSKCVLAKVCPRIGVTESA